MSDAFIIFVLILLSGVFAISEISLAAARKIKLRVMVEEGNVRAGEVLALQEQPGAFFAMIQIALNAIAILGGIVGEATLTPYMVQFVGIFYSGPLLDQLGFILSFTAVTSLFILFADLLPKRVGMTIPETVAIRVIRPMRFMMLLLKPLVAFFNGLTNIVLKLLKLPLQREDTVTTDDIVAMMDAGAEHGSLQEQEYHLLGNVFELEGRTVPTAMTTREHLVYFDISDSSAEISAKIVEHPHNWFLVCDGSLDKVVGAIESKEILRQVLKGEAASISNDFIERDLLFLPDTLTLAEGLNAFKTTAKPFAVVLNEYALVVGILTVKDLMNSFMGNLVVPSGEDQIIQRDSNSWLVDGSTPVVDLARALELDTDVFFDNNQYETVAGFLIYHLKRIPKRADFIVFMGIKFEAVDIDNLRVDQLLVTRLDLVKQSESESKS
ncbi:hemolysin family protein [Thalassolituus oleivorans]|uniref:hemolysin family protein n=1 Tax=Thalassolituus oleivorans TaxID=187493 RepID=UPI00042DB83D|nr:hemolysin family protein [Thalassolituus oleivorans]AHK16315.1 membrane protein [Thalassolituus oleivorans R6-15]MCA6127250.1 membrane protein [Thalassolituus oleivorans 4BN06-13]